MERTSRACQSCHDRKIRCDGDTPCGTCARSSRACTSYVTRPRSSKITKAKTPGKRLRMITACDNCHTKHHKCDERDKCETCIIASVNCTYTLALERRAMRDAGRRSPPNPTHSKNLQNAQNTFQVEASSPPFQESTAAQIHAGVNSSYRSLHPQQPAQGSEPFARGPGTWTAQASHLTQVQRNVVDGQAGNFWT
jgi:hypothetical protein